MEIYICIKEYKNYYGGKYFIESKLESKLNGFNNLYFLCEVGSKKILPVSQENLDKYFISLKELRKQKLNKLSNGKV